MEGTVVTDPQEVKLVRLIISISHSNNDKFGPINILSRFSPVVLKMVKPPYLDATNAIHHLVK